MSCHAIADVWCQASRKRLLQAKGLQERTVDNGTNNLVNLSNEASIGAGEPGRQGRESIGSQRLEGATSHRGRSGKGSPPEVPGEAAVNSQYRKGKRKKRSSIDWETHLLNIVLGVEEREDTGGEE